jgi:hypothetical protein
MKILAVAVIVLVLTILISDYAVYASHYTGYRWLLPYTNVCYDSYSLALVNINGYTNNFNTVASELDQARSDWNNQPSIFTINRVNSCNNWVTSGYAPSQPWLARVIKTTQAGYIVDADMEINRYYNFVSWGRCSTPPYTLDYVARHEFGHYVEFRDILGWFPNSTMYGSYNCERWNSVKSYDSNELSSIYG